MLEAAFAEISSSCRRGARKFDVVVQSRLVESEFDVTREAGGCRRGVKRRYLVEVGEDERVSVALRRGSAGQPMVSYLKLVGPRNATAAPGTTTAALVATVEPATTAVRKSTAPLATPALRSAALTRSTAALTRNTASLMTEALTVVREIVTSQSPTAQHLKTSPHTPNTVSPTTTTSVAPSPWPSPAEVRCRGRGRVVRKEVNDMSASEWDKYVRAVKKLAAGDGGNSPRPRYNWYEYFSDAHRRHALHNQPSFLPWHRSMLWEWEDALHSVEPGVTQPYFDWSRSYSNLFSNSAFATNRFGGKDNDGAFQGMRSSVPRDHAVTRDFVKLALRSEIFLKELVRGTTGDFESFRISLEAAHNTFHAAIGGRRGDMSASYSPNEMLFYAHHSFIDLIFQEWLDNSRKNEFSGASMEMAMAPWKDTIENAVTGELAECVTYRGSSFARQVAFFDVSLVAADPAYIDSEKEREASANASEAAKKFGADKATLAKLSAIDAKLMSSIGVSE